ncbi:MAG: Unknown protein [uncultured Sulfurovum sp.]|uniref:Uncharacterized protein n=1 Tax=uncultured Sulfurovum sp. TaxID=269237 RepID=A0A6S6SSZ1_9BACT|nr:MAG: Unknown protein [uncultured Sulfurovum sp.]
MFNYNIKVKGDTMKSIATKNILLSLFLLVGLTSHSFSESSLPVSKQLKATSKGAIAPEEKIEIVPEIKIQGQTSVPSKNPNLKEGDACSDENLEEVEGEIFTEIPMAETIPCDKVNCEDLAAAKLEKDDYKKLNNAKTIACDK